MAEAFFNQAAHGRARAISAGSRPAKRVHPEVVIVMNEAGIDLSDKIPRKFTREILTGVDYTISMGCREACPVTGSAMLDWHIEDPSGKPLSEVRRIRDEIREKVAQMIAELKI
jgi:arsenate reductase